MRILICALVLMTAPLMKLTGQEGVYDWTQGEEKQTGIRFVRMETQQPRKMVVHGARIDSWVPGLRLHTTPRRHDWVEGKTETDRQTTREFLRQSRSRGLNTVLAVNADAFSPWPVPYNESTPTDLLGLAVCNRDQRMLNVEQRVPEGSVTVALLDESGSEIAGLGFAESVPITCDSVRAPVSWTSGKSLRSLVGKKVQLAVRIRGKAVVYAVAFHSAG